MSTTTTARKRDTISEANSRVWVGFGPVPVTLVMRDGVVHAVRVDGHEHEVPEDATITLECVPSSGEFPAGTMFSCDVFRRDLLDQPWLFPGVPAVLRLKVPVAELTVVPA